MRLTERDQEIIQGIYEYRLLTSQQIEALFFPSGTQESRSLRSSCQRRLQKLYHYGYLDRIQRPVVLGEGRHAFAYALDKEGASIIVNRSGIDREEVDWKPKRNRFGPLFLEHSLLISDMRVVVALLMRSSYFYKMAWIDELKLKSAEYSERCPLLSRITKWLKSFRMVFFLFG